MGLAYLKSGDPWSLFLNRSVRNVECEPGSPTGLFLKRAGHRLCLNGEDTLIGEFPAECVDIRTSLGGTSS